jgi:hypothetical protein
MEHKGSPVINEARAVVAGDAIEERRCGPKRGITKLCF